MSVVRSGVKVAFGFAIALISVFARVESAENGAVLHGTVEGVAQQKVYLLGAGAEQSAPIVNGKFEFHFHIDRPPAVLRLELREPDKNGRQYWILGHSAFGDGVLADNRGDIQVKIAPAEQQDNPGYVFLTLTSSLEDTAIGREYLAFQKEAVDGGIEPLVIKHGQLVGPAWGDVKSASIGDGPGREDRMREKLGEYRYRMLQTLWKSNRELWEIVQDYWIDYIKKHAVSNEALFAWSHASSSLAGRLDAQARLDLFATLDPRVQATALGAGIKEQLSTELAKGSLRKSFSAGSAFRDFSLQDKDGKSVRVGSLLKPGRYVLLDFWASWCGPCRAENPNVLAQYRKFHDRGFDVVAVSLDTGKAAWIKAVEQDGMPWMQLSDLKGWESAAAKLYGVNGIPDNFLLDGNGTVVGQGLRGLELEKRLSELFP